LCVLFALLVAAATDTNSSCLCKGFPHTSQTMYVDTMQNRMGKDTPAVSVRCREKGEEKTTHNTLSMN